MLCKYYGIPPSIRYHKPVSVRNGPVYFACKPKPHSLAGRGISLVELLVVVALLAMLVAVFVGPMLAAARERVRRTACAANLRTIAQGWQLYLGEHSAFPVEDLIGMTTLEMQYGGMAKPPTDKAMTGPRFERPINRYIHADENDPASTQMFRCPSDRGLQGSGGNFAREKTVYESLGNSYPMNTHLLHGRSVAGSGLHGLRLQDVEGPLSLVVLAGDFMMRARGAADWPYHGYWHDREDRQVNLVFLDGHADFVRLQPGRDDAAGYRFGVRW